jgi:uncharacterized membrane protein YeaQ/YmgE (transglycosylase-associated protein family)
MDGLTLFIGVVVAIVCGFAGSHIMKSKGRSAGAGAVLGVLLGVIGLLITLAISPSESHLKGKNRPVYEPAKLPGHISGDWR